MRRLVLSPEASADIVEIGRYSRRIWGADQARRYSESLADRLIGLKRSRRPGRPRADIDPMLRSLKSARHIIFFYLETDQIIVVRILHERMAPAARLVLRGPPRHPGEEP